VALAAGCSKWLSTVWRRIYVAQTLQFACRGDCLQFWRLSCGGRTEPPTGESAPHWLESLTMWRRAASTHSLVCVERTLLSGGRLSCGKRTEPPTGESAPHGTAHFREAKLCGANSLVCVERTLLSVWAPVLWQAHRSADWRVGATLTLRASAAAICTGSVCACLSGSLALSRSPIPHQIPRQGRGEGFAEGAGGGLGYFRA
jgi:hypothetical protein